MKHVNRNVKFIPQEDYPPMSPDDVWYPVIYPVTGETLAYNKTHDYYMTAQGWKLPGGIADNGRSRS
jgi:hypothetical protein